MVMGRIVMSEMSEISNHTSGTVHMFDLSPGDGTTYRVLFGRLPPTSAFFSSYVLFGLAEGTDAIITLAFTGTGELISFDIFSNHWRTATFTSSWGGIDYIERTAYTVFAALIGLPDVEPPGNWAEDWRERLPLAALG